MPFPSPSATVPSLTAYRWSWLGYEFGADSDPLQIQKIEGLDLGSVRTGDSGRARDHGRFIGLDLMDGRDIIITGQILLTYTNWQALAGVLTPGGVTESPLWFNLPGWGTLACMARVRKHNMPLDIQATLGQLANITIQFSCSDPRIYSTPTLNPSVGLPTPNAGFSFPLTFPLAFGGGGSVGTIQATNAGNVEMRPLLVVNGPCTTPTIQNNTASGAPYLAFGMSLNSGDQLIIDTDMHTATYYTPGFSTGTPRTSTLQAGSQWFSLLPAHGENAVTGGVNDLAFSSKDQTLVSGTLEVYYASSWIL